MVRVRVRGELVRKFILEHLGTQRQDIVRATSKRFKISRQAVHKHLGHLIDEKAIVASGTTSQRSYRLAPLLEWRALYELGDNVTEDAVWLGLAPSLGVLPDNVLRIWDYCFTEMFNNAIDHSGGSHISVNMTKTATFTEIAIFD
ncbi:MAG: STAS-like domain-containing protein, partial [Polyangiaceae bacterium]